MDFGKVEKSMLSKIDFTLQPDSDFTKYNLEQASKGKKPMVYVGCPKWGTKEWVGQIYPKGTKEVNFLDHYVNHFNSIELNATHYKIYGADTVSKWSAKAKQKDFLFCPKIPKVISHESNLISPEAARNTDDFLKGILAFKEHLGPVFLQLSDSFSPSMKTNLYAYLKSLPHDLQFFLELRNPEWFENRKIRSEWLQLLSELRIGSVITDSSGRRDCVHMELPVPKTFIRFVGNNLHETDYSRIDKWILRIKHWLENGLQELYFFVHQQDEKDSPKLCNYLIEQLNLHCGTHLKPAKFISDTVENTLF